MPAAADEAAVAVSACLPGAAMSLDHFAARRMTMRTLMTGLLIAGLLFGGAAAGSSLLDKAKERLNKDKAKPAGQASPAGSPADEKTVAAGLKEALSIGSQKAVEAVAKQDGYLGNPKIKIPLPDNIAKTERMLRKVGLAKQVDEFVLTLNRAAEKAAPVAKDIFIGAVKEMTVSDAVGILRGGDTAATGYFRAKTGDTLYTAFKPGVAKTVKDVGVTKAYQSLVDQAKKMKVIKDQSLDLDHYVTTKALDGLFTMVGEEEKKIRKDPVARTTDLLKQVFGK